MNKLVISVLSFLAGAATIHFGEEPIAKATFTYAMSHGLLYLYITESEIHPLIFNNNITTLTATTITSTKATPAIHDNIIIQGCGASPPETK